MQADTSHFVFHTLGFGKIQKPFPLKYKVTKLHKLQNYIEVFEGLH